MTGITLTEPASVNIQRTASKQLDNMDTVARIYKVRSQAFRGDMDGYFFNKYTSPYIGPLFTRIAP